MAVLDFFFDWWDGRNLGARGPKWRETQQAFIAIHSTCAYDGNKGTLLNPLQVHHVIPFSKDPTKENDWDNLQTVCRFHHLEHSHLGSWKSHNPHTKEDAAAHLAKIKTRP